MKLCVSQEWFQCLICDSCRVPEQHTTNNCSRHFEKMYVYCTIAERNLYSTMCSVRFLAHAWVLLPQNQPFMTVISRGLLHFSFSSEPVRRPAELWCVMSLVLGTKQTIEYGARTSFTKPIRSFVHALTFKVLFHFAQ